MDCTRTSFVRRIGLLFLVSLIAAASARAAVGAWSSIGPPGGAVSSLAFDPQQPNRWYASLLAGGLFRSVDGGATWARLATPFISGTRPFFDVDVDPTDSQHLIVVVSRANGVEVWHSLDGGTTWSELYSHDFNQTGVAFGSRLEIDPTDPTRLFSAGLDGIFRSTDGGVTWGLPAGGQFYPYTWLVAADGVLYAYDGFEPGMSKSVDHGVTWSPINTGLPLPLSVGVIADDPTDPLKLYLGTSGSVYRTVDGGASWTAGGSGLPLQDLDLLIVDRSTPSTLHAMTQFRLYRSTDSGASFAQVSPNLPDQRAILVSDPSMAGRLFLGSRDRGLFVSNDGGSTWSRVEGGFHATRVLALAAHPTVAADLSAAVDWDDLVLTANGGGSWSPTPSLDFRGRIFLELAISPLNAQLRFASLTDSSPRSLRSTNGGTSWAQLSSGAGWPTGAAEQFAFDPADPLRILAAHQQEGAVRSLDGGATWTLVSSGLPGGAATFGAVAIDPRHPQRLYVGARDGGGKVFRSEDGGATWTLPSPGPTLGLRIAALAVDPRQAGVLYASDGATIWRSADYAQTWTAAGPPVGVIETLAIDPEDSTTLYAGTGSGVYVSSNSGASWSRLGGDELAGQWVSEVVIDPTNRWRIYAAVYGAGVWEFSFPLIFADGFESGDTSAWSALVP